MATQEEIMDAAKTLGQIQRGQEERNAPDNAEVSEPSEVEESTEVAEENPEPAIEPVAEKDPVIEEDLDIQKKLEKTKESMQKRIDKLTAEKKDLEARFDERLNKIEEAGKNQQEEVSIQDQISYERDQYIKEKKTLRRKAYEALNDGNDDLFDDLVNEEAKIDTLLKRLDDKFFEVKRGKQAQEQEERVSQVRQQWESTWEGVMDEFPELRDSNGTLDMDSPLTQEALRIMSTNAKKPKWATFANAINPKYDHANGPEMAVLAAARKLSLVTDQVQQDSQTRTEKRQSEHNQVTTGGSNANISDIGKKTQRKVDDMIDSIGNDRARGIGMRGAIDALSAIKDKHGVRSGGR